jgi:hypothetical protein
VAVVVVAATAAVIGLSSLSSTETIAPARPVAVVTDLERLANSTAAIREQGAVAPVAVGISHVTPSVVGFAGLENPAAYAPQLPAYAGFENPGAYPVGATEGTGGPTTNPCPLSCQQARP